jgi:hypothetical protein
MSSAWTALQPVRKAGLENAANQQPLKMTQSRARALQFVRRVT